MSKRLDAELTCPNCETKSKVKIYRTFWLEDPANLKMFFDGLVNVFPCPTCDYAAPLNFGVFFTNKAKRYAVWFEPSPDPAIDRDIEAYKKLGPSDYFATAPRFRTMVEVMAHVKQMEARPTAPRPDRTGQRLNMAKFLEVAHGLREETVAHAKLEEGARLKALRAQGPSHWSLGWAVLATLVTATYLAFLVDHDPASPLLIIGGIVLSASLIARRAAADPVAKRTLWRLGFEVPEQSRELAHRMAHVIGLTLAILAGIRAYYWAGDELHSDLVLPFTALCLPWAYFFAVTLVRGYFWATAKPTPEPKPAPQAAPEPGPAASRVVPAEFDVDYRVRQVRDWAKRLHDPILEANFGPERQAPGPRLDLRNFYKHFGEVRCCIYTAAIVTIDLYRRNPGHLKSDSWQRFLQRTNDHFHGLIRNAKAAVLPASEHQTDINLAHWNDEAALTRFHMDQLVEIQKIALRKEAVGLHREAVDLVVADLVGPETQGRLKKHALEIAQKILQDRHKG